MVKASLQFHDYRGTSFIYLYCFFSVYLNLSDAWSVSPNSVGPSIESRDSQEAAALISFVLVDRYAVFKHAYILCSLKEVYFEKEFALSAVVPTKKVITQRK